MGNKVGFQIQHKHIKIVYLAKYQTQIDLFENINSQFLKQQLPLKNGGVFFFFKFTFQQFVNLKSSEKVKLLRQHFKQDLDTKIQIFMNKQTSLLLQYNQTIKQTIKDLLCSDFEEKNRHNIQSSILSLNVLNFLSKQNQFFYFKNNHAPNALHDISSKIDFNKQYKNLPQQTYIFASLRKGTLFFKVNGNSIQKKAGSIIGQQTISQILQFKYKQNQQIEIDQIIKNAFQNGNNLKTDLLVEDIYGKTFHGLGINGNLIASSLGKLGKNTQQNLDDQAKSLLIAFGINIGQFLVLQMAINKLNNCILVANKFHNKYFYYIVQCIVKAFSSNSEILFADHGNYISCLGNIQYN